MLFAVSDLVFQALIAAIAAVALAWMNHKATVEARKAETAREQAKEDAKVKDVKLDEIAKTAEKTYTFQNHQMSVVLNSLRISARAISDLRPDDMALKEAANAAEKDFKRHEEGQAKVDAQILITEAERRARDLVLSQKEAAEKADAVTDSPNRKQT